MIVGAALCPSPPLLARALTGQAVVLPELRDACAVAVAELVAGLETGPEAGPPDLVVVVGPAATTTVTGAAGRLDLSRYAPRPGPGGPGGPGGTSPSDHDPALALAVGIGAMLLDESGYAGRRLLQSVADSASPDDCLRLGRRLAAAAPRVALLVMGEGSARRSLRAPGYLDERAEPFDAAIERAVRDGDLTALAAIDPALADDLMATGRPAWQVLAGALGWSAPGDDAARAIRPAAAIRYCEAPLGVAYLVATLTPGRGAEGGADGGTGGGEPDGELDA